MGLLDALRNRRIGEDGRRAERATCNRLQAEPTLASGATGAQGDGHLGRWMVEAKTTEKGSYRLDLGLLVRCWRRARAHGMIPAVHVEFTGPAGRRAGADARWVLIPERRFRDLVGDGEERTEEA